jgi:hypothetical protein
LGLERARQQGAKGETIMNRNQVNLPDENANSSDDIGSSDSKPNCSSEWNTHEHQSERARMQAQQLVQETGSSELAKHVIDEVAHEIEQLPDQAAFARQFGFESYLAMFEASTPMNSDDGRNWLITTIAGGEWIAWNESELGTYQKFQSLEEAARLIGAEESRAR